MPNHVHLLLKVNRIDPLGERQGDAGRQGQSPCPTVGDVVGALKSITTKRANEQDGVRGRKIWQFRFHDRIICTEAEYQCIWQYIDENPAKWAEDRYCITK
ncbi:MAG: transposase [Oscillospiraceae bacterium]|nr:transposase [Oscillospiraceae bacterium]